MAGAVLAGLLTGCTAPKARMVRDFDFDWKFIKEDVPGAQALEYDDSGWRDVQVPHDWSIEGPYSQEWASGTGFLPAGIGWYRKTFPVDPSLQGKIITIEFDGVYNNSDVWINGQHLGRRPFGYIGFEYDLTPHIIFGNENVVAVRVDHSDFADSRWYTGSGIYRHVRLNIMEPVHIAYWGTYVTTPKVDLPASANMRPSAEVKMQTTVENKSGQMQSVSLFSEVYAPDGQIVARLVSSKALEAGKTEVFEQETALSDVQLWDLTPAKQYPSGRSAATSPYQGEELTKAGEMPVSHSANAHGQAQLDRATRTNNTGGTPMPLYTLKSVVKVDGKVVDEIQTPFGIRTFAFDPDNGFTLNGRNLKRKGMCLHHDGGVVGAAVPEKMWVR
ncbi:MAG: beta galactosidase jelly roll domain-containing protein, partial [Eubacteriales bacterium]|nr:beta galactosidase jelly roll domain-containing protein [Eubacteriales bacterium]